MLKINLEKLETYFPSTFEGISNQASLFNSRKVSHQRRLISHTALISTLSIGFMSNFLQNLSTLSKEMGMDLQTCSSISCAQGRPYFVRRIQPQRFHFFSKKF